MGTIETIWVDNKEGVLFHATFDDNDVALSKSFTNCHQVMAVALW